jgi:hypothetical protein
MPHASDLLPTPHEGHDPLLVAAFAADDLVGADRDDATSLMDSCADCATLHADLVAIARATAVVPPPVRTTPRDFRLTEAEAARLRPGGWRRLADALRAPGRAALRPLGAGLTTFGLVGLLVANVQLAPTAAAPTSRSLDAAGSGTGDTRIETAAGSALPMTAASGQVDTAAGPVPAASSAAAAGAGSAGDPSPAAASDGSGGIAARPAETSSPVARDNAGGTETLTQPPPAQPMRPANVLFIAAVLGGIGLLVASRLRGRFTG